jgi:putative Mn2+ efflux pump MntP
VLLGLLALAVVDSINPSAIVVTLYLMSRQRPPAHILAYIAAIFLTYLTLGMLMMLGLDALLPSAGAAIDSRLGFIIQGFIGLALLVYAFRAPAAKSAPPTEPRATSYAALALLGVTVTTMELPTAVPYFGAMALLAGLPAAEWLPLLVLYNAIFVLPPVLLLAGHVAFGSRMDARYAGLRERLQAGARETMLWICGLVGGALLFTSVVEYAARFW